MAFTCFSQPCLSISTLQMIGRSNPSRWFSSQLTRKLTHASSRTMSPDCLIQWVTEEWTGSCMQLFASRPKHQIAVVRKFPSKDTTGVWKIGARLGVKTRLIPHRLQRLPQKWSAGLASACADSLILSANRGLRVEIRDAYLAFGTPEFTEREIEAVARVMRSGWVGMGAETIAFENELAAYVGAPEVVSVNSCTSALFLALLVEGIGAGDEVIVPSLTWCATANAALYLD